MQKYALGVSEAPFLVILRVPEPMCKGLEGCLGLPTAPDVFEPDVWPLKLYLLLNRFFCAGS